MTEWTKDELAVLNEVTTVQNHPFDDNGQSFQDYPIWIVTNHNNVYLRAGKGKDSKWYEAGLKNGGQIEFNGENYAISYVAVDDPQEIKNVTQAYLDKYHGQYPIDMMISDKCAEATVKLVRK
ncbi:DUF2255 family protein [Lactobacillus crispatus]|uniref:DUF2255 family protein n=1 Tax=Lactobacillus crispatus TaxID=47770 RepID=A0A7H9E8N8_9LACO|nr:DUF2255 family protein [Lactobacillus crispatus]MDK6376874.1 DUF2255 family protein [Lactobacillus crispatus]MDK8508729.1 DUF2255 family protein [Lactobacillus crispatus]QLL74008.1 DUF2255 family protein [Lactobacillus crispatus]